MVDNDYIGIYPSKAWAQFAPQLDGPSTPLPKKVKPSLPNCGFDDIAARHAR